MKEGDKLSEGDDLVEMTVQEDSGDDGDEESDADADSKSASQKDDKASKEKREDESEKDDEEAKTSKSEDSQGDSTYQVASPGARVHAGPAVRKVARELGADLTKVKPSGPKDRILKEDVEGYIRQNLKKPRRAVRWKVPVSPVSSCRTSASLARWSGRPCPA